MERQTRGSLRRRHLGRQIAEVNDAPLFDHAPRNRGSEGGPVRMRARAPAYGIGNRAAREQTSWCGQGITLRRERPREKRVQWDGEWPRGVVGLGGRTVISSCRREDSFREPSPCPNTLPRNSGQEHQSSGRRIVVSPLLPLCSWLRVRSSGRESTLSPTSKRVCQG